MNSRSGADIRASQPGPVHIGFRIAAAIMCLGLLACDPFEPFQFATFNLHAGLIGRAYADTIRTVGARGRVSMRLIDGNLPPGVGLRVAKSDGILYGVPTRVGDFQFTVEAQDDGSNGDTLRPALVTQGFAIVVDSL